MNQRGFSKVLLVILVFVVSAGLAGAGVWYYFGVQYKKDKDEKSSEINNLQKQLAEAKKDNENKKEDTKTDVFSDTKLPVVIFKPDTFTAKEKSDLTAKVINPFMDYQKLVMEPTNPLIVVEVTKYTDAEVNEKGYYYVIDYINKTEGYGGWLERAKGKPIDWWIPDCLNKCEFNAEFTEKYPEVVNKYNAL